jgi:hypothetical protein
VVQHLLILNKVESAGCNQSTNFKKSWQKPKPNIVKAESASFQKLERVSPRLRASNYQQKVNKKKCHLKTLQLELLL